MGVEADRLERARLLKVDFHDAATAAGEGIQLGTVPDAVVELPSGGLPRVLAVEGFDHVGVGDHALTRAEKRLGKTSLRIFAAIVPERERPRDVVAEIAAAGGEEDARAGPGGGLRGGDGGGRSADHDDIHLVDDGNLRRAGRHRGAQKARHHKRCRKRCREHCHKLCREHCRSIFPATIE